MRWHGERKRACVCYLREGLSALDGVFEDEEDDLLLGGELGVVGGELVHEAAPPRVVVQGVERTLELALLRLELPRRDAQGARGFGRKGQVPSLVALQSHRRTLAQLLLQALPELILHRQKRLAVLVHRLVRRQRQGHARQGVGGCGDGGVGASVPRCTRGHTRA